MMTYWRHLNGHVTRKTGRLPSICSRRSRYWHAERTTKTTYSVLIWSSPAHSAAGHCTNIFEALNGSTKHKNIACRWDTRSGQGDAAGFPSAAWYGRSRLCSDLPEMWLFEDGGNASQCMFVLQRKSQSSGNSINGGDAPFAPSQSSRLSMASNCLMTSAGSGSANVRK
ncbi:Hypothetical protein mma_1755 [Janthinobacterium sp. Marseille]|nr:Hypothetical protein mma_1755 [Janthinobacterium sp. Marseille]